MAEQFQNFFVTKLREACDATATTIYVDTVPAITEGTLVLEYANSTKHEIIHFTGVSGYGLTGCTRGLEGTTAQSHSAGTDVRQNLTAGMIDKIINGVITTENIANSAVTTAKINNGAVTADKIDFTTLTASNSNGSTFTVPYNAYSDVVSVDVSHIPDGKKIFVYASARLSWDGTNITFNWNITNQSNAGLDGPVGYAPGQTWGFIATLAKVITKPSGLTSVKLRFQKQDNQGNVKINAKDAILVVIVLD